MGISKWISGAIGWAVAGPLGGLLGYALASLLEKQDGTSKHKEYREYSPVEERNSFLVSLLVLSSSVMKADGKVMQSELSYVKAFIVKNFGPDAGAEATRYLRELLKKEINISEVGTQIKRHMAYEARVQLLHYLAGIASADGSVTFSEINVIKSIAIALDVSSADSQSILAMFDNGTGAAYKILELPEDASDDEVKKAYRRLAVMHHPDKVSHLGPDIQKAAEEKFKKITEAYDKIRKDRGIN